MCSAIRVARRGGSPNDLNEIEEKAHTPGLTEYMKRLLEEKSGRKFEPKAVSSGDFQFRREDEEKEEKGNGEFQFR